MALRFALYDLDNTLYSHTSGVLAAINDRIGLFMQERLQLDRDAVNHLRQHYYDHYGTTLAGLQKHHSVVETEDYLTYVHDVALNVLTVDDGELGAVLGALPLQKVIFTNSPREHATRILAHLGVSDHFSHVFDLRVFEFVAKPHPTAYQFVLRTLGATGAECVLFEDTSANLAPAKALGMTTVLIAPADTPPHSDADWMACDVLAATRRIHDLVAEAEVGSR